MLSKADTKFIGTFVDSIVAMPRDQNAIATSHSVVRINPKDEPFLGTCDLCGATNLTAEQATRETCPNPRRITEGDVFLGALDRANEASPTNRKAFAKHFKPPNGPLDSQWVAVDVWRAPF